MPSRASVPRHGSDGFTWHPDSLVPSKGSSLTLGGVQVRASQGRRGRDTGVVSRLRRPPRGACLGAAKRQETSFRGHWRRLLYRPLRKTHTLRYGAVFTDHHRRTADDLLCRRGCSGAAVRRPPDASLALGDRDYLPAASRCCVLAAARTANPGVVRHLKAKAAPEGTRRRH
jgi:hypothetical protein